MSHDMSTPSPGDGSSSSNPSLNPNRKRWPELSERLLIGSGYPLSNCGRERLHNPHIVGKGDHAEWGEIFAPYHCDGNLPRNIFNTQETAPDDWRQLRRNGYPGIPAIDKEQA